MDPKKVDRAGKGILVIAGAALAATAKNMALKLLKGLVN